MKIFRLYIKSLAHTVRDFAILSKKIYLRSKIPLILSTAKIERYEKAHHCFDQSTIIIDCIGKGYEALQ
jgi:hypothetical protein